MLHLDLAVRGGLRPVVSGEGLGVNFVSENDAAALTYGGLKAWDATGRLLTARFEARGTGLTVSVDDRGATYPITIDPIAQQAYLKAFNTGAGDSFGGSVAVSGDTVVVGAPNEDSNTTGVNSVPDDDGSADFSGAAYVFVRSGGSWSQQAYLKPSNTGAGDAFGNSVSVSGDTVVVGAPSEDSKTTGVDSVP
ncbi:MAG: FG-GAP repeat protein, partial [Verrucomicrobiae bacterium]|nr:FG-GAP repeat protein [Verrucomicrobiae bacterium]